MRAFSLWPVVLPCALAACATTPPPSAPDGSSAQRLLNIPLAASRLNAGETAWATLVGRGDRTDTTITASGVPPQVSRPVHLYTYIYGGTCGTLAARPSHALTGVVLARTGAAVSHMGAPFTVANTADVPLSELRATPHAIVVRSAPADGNLDLFCGNIAGLAPGEK